MPRLRPARRAPDRTGWLLSPSSFGRRARKRRSGGDFPSGKPFVHQGALHGHADQFGEGLSILSITNTSTTALVA